MHTTTETARVSDITRHPAEVAQPGHAREKDKLPRGVAGGQHADHDALPRLEPARRDQRPEIGAGGTAAEPDDDAPQ